MPTAQALSAKTLLPLPCSDVHHVSPGIAGQTAAGLELPESWLRIAAQPILPPPPRGCRQFGEPPNVTHSAVRTSNQL